MPPPPSKMPSPVCLGVITGAHGIKGAIRLKTFTEHAKQIKEYGPLSDSQGNSYILTVLSIKESMIIASLEGVLDRSHAETLKGTQLFVDRSKLPDLEKGEFYQTDLIGVRAETDEGKFLGIVIAVLNFGASDMLSIKDEEGRVMEVPFLEESVPTVDLKAGKLIIAHPYTTFVTAPDEKERSDSTHS